MESFKHDSLQALSDRLQQLSDISSRFDALTKETEEKLHNVIETANVLQQKMTPINKEIEVLRDKKKGYESCRQFLKQTSSYQVTTEKYIQEIQQSKINDVEEYVNLLAKAKESLDFFSTYLPGEKNAENLHYIISEGSKGLRDKFKEQLTSLTQTDRMQPEKCLTLSGIQPVDLQSFVPKFNEKQLQELRLIANWLDSQGKTSDYMQIYIEVRSLSLCSTLKKFRDSLLGIGNNTFGTSPSLPRRGGPRDTPSKPALQRRIRSKPTALGQPPSALTGVSGLDTSDQPELDSEDVNAMMTALLRLAMIEALILPKFSLKLDKPQLLLVDQIVVKAKETLFEDVHAFAATVRREFKQDPETLLRLISFLDRLRLLRGELSSPLCAPDLRAGVDDLAKDMRTQARGSLEDFRDDIVKEGGGGGGGSSGGGGSVGSGVSATMSASSAGSAMAASSSISLESDERRSLPADGTVHELTLMTLKFLQQLHAFGDTAHEILARDSVPAQQAGMPGSQQQQQELLKAKVLGGFLGQTLANMLRTLDSRADQYSDSALRAIFLLNNYRYVQQRLESDKMTPTIQAFNLDAVRFFEENQKKNRESYLNRGLQKCVAPLLLATAGASAAAAAAPVGEASAPVGKPASSSHGPAAVKHASVVKLSDKEKALIKEKFKSFNEEFMSAHKIQGNYSVPDPDLRKDLIQANKAFLLDKYSIFRDKYANVPFTSKKEKYVKYTREDIDRLLEEFFRGV